MTVYERIKMLRIEKGMRQNDLAKKVGYAGRSAISKVEKGNRDISQSMIAKYAEALHVTPAYLLYGKEDAPSEQAADERTDAFVKFYRQLTDEQQAFMIAAMKGILSNH